MLISRLFAFVKLAKVANNTKENMTMRPIRNFSWGTKYRPRMDRMGSSDDATTAQIRTKFRSLPSEYRVMPPLSPASSEPFTRIVSLILLGACFTYVEAKQP